MSAEQGNPSRPGKSNFLSLEALGNTRIGQMIIRILASIMESRLRYIFFGPEKILEGAGIHKEMKVLEVGCGTGYFTIPAGRIIGEKGSLVSIDVLPISVETVAKKVREEKLSNVQVIKRDALDTMQESGTLDEILVFGVIPAPMLPMQKLMQEMHRILKPGGIMAVWPPSWVHQDIIKSGLFRYESKKKSVMNYKKIESVN